ncbi:MAG: hypothetical protein WD844_14725 [Thermoleophilaceae bacterium]
MTVRETVLLVIEAAGGKVEGRTPIQKLCYFAALALDEDLGHRAHYYGPYSREVEVALENETFAGDLDETMRTFNAAGREGRQYAYELTDQGREFVEEIRVSKPGAADRVAPIVKQLGDLVPGYRQHPLSLAAKVDLILRQQGSLMADQIPAVANGLGWDVNDNDVAEAVHILVGIGRVGTPETPPSA